jgi:hypothetical protein
MENATQTSMAMHARRSLTMQPLPDTPGRIQLVKKAGLFQVH